MTEHTVTILVVEDNPVTRKLFRVTLETAGYRVLEAEDARTALALMSSGEAPDLILQDLRLPDMDGGDLAGRIRALPQGPEIPIIAVSGLLAGLEAGRVAGAPFDDYLAKPVDASRLLETVGVHLAPRREAPASDATRRRVVVADDDPMQRKLLALRLGQLGFSVEAVGDGAAALERVRREPPDAVVSDVLMPQLDGFGLCLAIRQDHRTAHVPVVLTSSSYVEQEDHELAAKAGADAYVLRTPDFRGVIDALEESLARGPRPASAAVPEAIATEHLQRVLLQTERQAARNVMLAERNARLTAELAALVGIAEALTRVHDARAAAHEILARCLEAGGVSRGMLYLDGPEGSVRHVTEIGFPELRTDVADFFGHGALLRQLIAGRSVVAIPSDAIPADAAREILDRSGLASILAAAVPVHGQPAGALVLGSDVGNLEADVGVGFARTVAVQIGQALALTGALRERDLLLESAGEGICGLDRDGRTTLVNPAAARMLGHELAELIGRLLDEVVHDHEREPPAEASQECTLASAVRGGLRRTGGDTFRRGDATRFPVQYTLAPIVDESYRIGAVLTFRDVTRQTQLEEQVRLAQKLEAVGTLAGGVAHDFNNLLAAIKGTADLALMDLEPESAVRKDLEEIGEFVNRAAALTRQLLAFGRKQVLDPHPLDLNVLLSGTVRMLERIIGEDVRLAVHESADPTTVLADPGQLEQVLMNLCVNARDAMPNGGELTIVTERVLLDERFCRTRAWARPGDFVRLTVRDSGMGMDPATLARIFEPFFTTKEMGRGTGLGLAVVYGIVNQHNGLIHVSSEPREGTAFEVYLPFHAGAPEAMAAEAAADLVGGTETILLGEDEVPLRATMKRLLERLGYQVIAAANGREAVELLARSGNTIHLAILDVVMPELSGPAVVEQVRSRYPGLRFLLITGYNPGAANLPAVQDLPAEALRKPFGLPELARSVRRVLDAPGGS